MLSRWRRAGAGLAVALFLLGGAEVAARLAAGPPPPTLVADLPGAGDLWREGDGKLEPTWQREGSTGPIPLDPTPGRPRVLWLGGSSVRGGNPDVPLDAEAPALLGDLLRVESLNLGGPGLDAGHVLALLPGALRLHPDVVVVYSGHNDLGNAVFFHRYGDARSAWVARIRALLGRSRLFSLAESTVRGHGSLPEPGTESAWRVDAAARARIHRTYAERLHRIAALVREAGARLVLVTVASNALTPYLEPSCPAELRNLGLPVRQRPNTYAVDRVSPEALAAALARAPGCPDLRWVQARLDADAGKAEALEVLDRLRDEDPLPLRADRAMVEQIRAVTRDEGAWLADADARFREAGGGLEPAAWFVDFVHFTAQGQRAVAAVVAPVVATALGRPEPPVELPRPAPTRWAACQGLACGGAVPRPHR